MNIKIFQTFHKEYPATYSRHWLIPIGVSGYIPKNNRVDSDGENISVKNSSYCELTVQYYSWKNIEADYYGFYHYCRYLSFKKLPFESIEFKKEIDLNNIIENVLTSDEQYKILLEILSNYDVIIPKKMLCRPSIEKQYLRYHNSDPWDKFKESIKEHYPCMKNELNYFDITSKMPYWNIFIMKKELFNYYCTDLYRILDNTILKLGNCYESENFNSRYKGLRYPGYLAERFLGFWLEINSINYFESNYISLIEKD